MARLHLCRVPISLLLVAGLTATATGKKVGMTMRYTDEEESRWMDRYGETHEPLGTGPLRARPATDEEARRLDSFGKPTKKGTGSHGEDGGAGGTAGNGDNYLEFDQDNPYYHAMRAWIDRLIKRSGGIQFENQEKPHVEISRIFRN